VQGKKQQQTITAKKSRAKHRCPAKVKELIDLVNSIPPDRDLPDMLEIFNQFDEDTAQSVEAMRALIAEAPNNFVSTTYSHPWPHLELDDEQMWVVARYDYFRSLRDDVRKIARQGMLASLSVEARIKYLTDNPNKLGWIGPRFQTYLTVNEAGLVVDEPDEWLPALIRIRADRLRACVICQRIFWARQDNMVACGARCGNVNRVRLFRERHSEYERAKKRKMALKARAATRRK